MWINLSVGLSVLLQNINIKKPLIYCFATYGCCYPFFLFFLLVRKKPSYALTKDEKKCLSCSYIVIINCKSAGNFCIILFLFITLPYFATLISIVFKSLVIFVKYTTKLLWYIRLKNNLWHKFYLYFLQAKCHCTPQDQRSSVQKCWTSHGLFGQLGS